LSLVGDVNFIFETAATPTGALKERSWHCQIGITGTIFNACYCLDRAAFRFSIVYLMRSRIGDKSPFASRRF